MSDDITFCGSDCDNKKCFRHPSNIREPRIPHSFAYLKGTEDCPIKKQEVRLIDADALKKDLTSDARDEFEFVCLSRVLEKIDNAPTVIWCSQTPDGLPLMDMRERPQGEWIKLRDYDFKCSLCGDSFMDKYDFCPDCGAQMQKGEEK